MRAVHRLQCVRPLEPVSTEGLASGGSGGTPNPWAREGSPPSLRALTRFLRTMPAPAGFLRAVASLLLPGQGPGWQHMPCGTACAFAL